MRINVILTLWIAVLLSIAFTSCKEESPEDIRSQLPEEALEYLGEYVKPEALWGFLNREGEIVRAPQYDLVSNFEQGLCAVQKAGAWYYINREGENVFGQYYRGAYPFSNGFARVQKWDGTYNFINLNGEELLKDDLYLAKDFNGPYSVVLRNHNSTASIINADGERAFDTPDFAHDQRIKDIELTGGDYAIFSLQEGELVYGFAEKSFLTEVYDQIKYGRESEFILRDGNKSRIVNIQSGKILCKGIAHGSYAGEGVYTGIVDDLPFFMRNGEFRKVYDYKHIQFVGEDLYSAVNQEGNINLINSKLEKLSENNYQQIYRFQHGMAGYMREGLWGYLDTHGREITRPRYGLIWPFHEGEARVMYREGMAIIDTSLNLVVTPGEADLRDFHEGMLAFKEQIN